MKKIFLLLFWISLIFNELSAQVVIKKSNDIIEIWGRKYYVHTVKPGETLYSISKVYKVPQSDILLINKEAVLKLKVGDKLRIPVVEDEGYKPEQITKITFIDYKVKKRKETLYSIAKKFGVSQDQIIKYNPDVVNGLKKGMILKIPHPETNTIYAEDEFFYYHQVEKGETLETIAKKYMTTIDKILTFNPSVSDTLPLNTIIAIPKRDFTDEQKYLLIYNKEIIPDFVDIDPNFFIDPNYPPCYKFSYNSKMTFNVALLLPLFITQNYLLSSESLSKPKTIKYYDKSKIFYDYLLGSLLAVFDLEQDSLNIHLYIYDTKADSNTVKFILSKNEFKSMDLVIGPVYWYNYQIVKQFADKYRINFISPFSKKTSILNNNPFVFKINPSYRVLIDQLAKYAVAQDTADIYLVDDGSSYIDDYHQQIAQIVANENITRNTLLIYKKIPFSKFVDAYKKNINSFKPAIVIVPYKDEVRASTVLNNLNALVESFHYSITVLGLPQWNNFTNLDPIWISNLQVHYPAPYFINYEDPLVLSFIKRYTRLFHEKPSIYAFGGYDIMRYFLYMLKRYGRYFQFCLNNEIPMPFTESMFLKMEFKRTGIYNGFENQGVYIIYYDKDLNLQKVNF